MNMICKGQVKGIEQGDSVSQVKLIEAIFGIAASGNANDTEHLSLKNFVIQPFEQLFLKMRIAAPEFDILLKEEEDG